MIKQEKRKEEINMKFVHIADMHFDSPFATLSDKGNLGEQRRLEQRKVMKDIEKLDKDYVLHTYARNYVNFKKGVNATLYDDENKDYIDFTSGIGVTSVGHGNSRVAKRIFEQVSNLTHTSNLYAIEPQALLAKKIKELSGL